jgi:methionyl-tRNA formyltransferase
MKLEFITEEDLYVLPLFEEFFRNVPADFEIVRVSCCRLMGNRPRHQLIRELIWLYGLVGFFRMAARHLVARLLSRLPRRPGRRRYYSIEQLCAAYGVEYARIGNPNAESFAQEVTARGADILVSVACPFILKRRLLEVPPLGCINLHNAPLPQYKGMMPTFWQLFHGERSVGLTIHYMTEKIDDGRVLFQDRLEIEPAETLDHLIRRSKRRAAHCLAHVLQELCQGTATPVPLGKDNSSYFTFPSRQQIREFHRRGLRAI